MTVISSNNIKILMDLPALPPPKGIMPTFSNSHSLPLGFALMGMLCVGLCTASVAIRLYARLRVIKKLWWDDCKLCQLLDMVD